uniref:(northern house mosquito) hypothetical protein n=1 Tax=Culex pipiens TaxID=7175 RepID=A0A8D8FXF0_CULPI
MLLSFDYNKRITLLFFVAAPWNIMIAFLSTRDASVFVISGIDWALSPNTVVKGWMKQNVYWRKLTCFIWNLPNVLLHSTIGWMVHERILLTCLSCILWKKSKV